MFKTFRPTFLTAEPPELNSGEPNPVEPGSSAVIDLTLSDGELSDGEVVSIADDEVDPAVIDLTLSDGELSDIGIVSEDDSASDLSTEVSDSDEEVSEVDDDHIDEMPPGPLILPPVNNLDAVPATVLPTQVQAVDQPAADLSTEVSDSDEEVSEVDDDHIDEMPPGPLILPPVNNLDAVPATVLPTQVQAVDQPAADQSTDDSNDSDESYDSDSSVLDSVLDW